jgi:hypothetical protein
MTTPPPIPAGPWLDADGAPYDPLPAIAAWRDGGGDAAADELWDRLCHQGTVNSASYAAVGAIVQMIAGQASPGWRAYALLASIEEGRLSDGNPPVPAALEAAYRDGWKALLPLALRDLAIVQDDLTVRSILACIAHAKGQHTLAEIALCTEDERLEMLGR